MSVGCLFGTTKDQGLYNKPSDAVRPGALAAGTLPQYNTIQYNTNFPEETAALIHKLLCRRKEFNKLFASKYHSKIRRCYQHHEEKPFRYTL
jgi:hypothetical protein